MINLAKSGLAESSVRRFRDSLSSFFAWTVRERMIATNLVTLTRVPKRAAPPVKEMYPYSEDELERVYRRAADQNQRLADLVLIDAWTGLRWSELRSIRVRDFVEVPLPMLVVHRAEPEGVEIKSTKSGRSSRSDRGSCTALSRACAEDRSPDRLFVTEIGPPTARHRVQTDTPLGPRSPTGGGSTTCGTRLPVCGWPAASTR